MTMHHRTGSLGVRPVSAPKAPKPTYTWRGEEFISQTDLAAEAGVDQRTIRLHLQRYGCLDHLQPGKPGRKSPKARSLTVGGVTYRSGRAFAAAHGLPQRTVCQWIEKGQMEKLEEAMNGGAA